MERQRERIDRARDQLRARSSRRERRGERAASGALHVDPDRQAARLGERADELLRLVRLQRAGRIVQQHAHGAELGQPLRALDQRVDLAGRAGAVDEARLEVALGRDDRLGRLAEVRHVVQRIVQAEDVDAVLGGRRDEAAREVGVDRARADEEAAAEREAERGLHARLQRADPLPRALDAALDGGVEVAAARDLEVREAGAVEDLGQVELGGHRHAPASGSCPSRRIVVSARVGTTAGPYRASGQVPTASIAAPSAVSTTADVTNTQPSGTGRFVRRQMTFCPDTAASRSTIAAANQQP